jgi:hypothetical protein
VRAQRENKIGYGFAAFDLDMREKVLRPSASKPATRTHASVRLSKAGTTAFYTVAIHCNEEKTAMAKEKLTREGGSICVALPMPGAKLIWELIKRQIGAPPAWAVACGSDGRPLPGLAHGTDLLPAVLLSPSSSARVAVLVQAGSQTAHN